MRAIAALVMVGLLGLPTSASAAGRDRVGMTDPRNRVVAAAWVEGGYSIPGSLGYRTALFTLYVDGRLLTSGDVDVHGVPTYRIAQLNPTQSRSLRVSFFRATSGVVFGDVPVADVGYTRTRATMHGVVAWQRINALGMDTGLTSAQRQARQRLQGVIDAAIARPSGAFAPTAYEVRRVRMDDPSIQVQWPGPRLPASECGTIGASAYAAFPAEFGQGSAYTWRGTAFALWVRPLLPGEAGCRGL